MKRLLERLLGTPAPLADEEPEIERPFGWPTISCGAQRSAAMAADVERHSCPLCDPGDPSYVPWPVPSVRALRDWREAK